MITSDVGCTREIKSRFTIAKAAFNRKKTFRQQIGLEYEEEHSILQHLEHSFVWY
jgi:hypothetical protein